MARRDDEGRPWQDDAGDENDAAPDGWEREGEQWKEQLWGNRIQIPEANGRELTERADQLDAEAAQRDAVERLANDVTREIQKAHPLKWAEPPKRTARSRKPKGDR